METPETMPFECEKCGACCRSIGYIKECAYLDNGQGVCKYYDETKSECKIYEFRPEICSVQKMYKKFKDKLTWEEYIKENKKACELLRKLEKNRKSKNK